MNLFQWLVHEGSMSSLQQFPVAEMEHLEGTRWQRVGRPVKRLHLEPDCAVQNKRGKKRSCKAKTESKKKRTKESGQSIQTWSWSLTNSLIIREMSICYHNFVVVHPIPLILIPKDSLFNKTLGRALDPRANGTWLSKLTE